MSERDALQAEHSTLDARLSTLVAERDALATERDALQAERSTLDSRLSTLAAEHDTQAAEERGRLAERISGLEEEKEKLLSEIARQHQRTGILEQEAESARKSIEERFEELAALTRMHVEVEAERDQLAEECKSLASNIEEVKRQHDTEMHESATHLGALDAELEASRSHAAGLEASLQAATAEAETRNQRISELEAEGEDARNNICERFEELAKLTRMLIEAEEGGEKLTAQLAESRRLYQNERGRLAESLTRLNAEATTLKSQLAAESTKSKELAQMNSSLSGRLEEKTRTLDRYIQESGKMSKLIVATKKNAALWRGYSTPMEAEEVVPGPKMDQGDFKHFDYTLKQVQHLGRCFSTLEVRITNHGGDAGILVFEPSAEERPFYGWAKSGTENGRAFMLVIPKHKSGREILFASTANDLLLYRGILYSLLAELENRAPEENALWIETCQALLNEIRALPGRLHYDDVKVLERNGGRVEVQMVNPSLGDGIIPQDRITIQGRKIQAIHGGAGKELPLWETASNSQRKIISAYRKELKNILFHVNK